MHWVMQPSLCHTSYTHAEISDGSLISRVCRQTRKYRWYNVLQGLLRGYCIMECYHSQQCEPEAKFYTPASTRCLDRVLPATLQAIADAGEMAVTRSLHCTRAQTKLRGQERRVESPEACRGELSCAEFTKKNHRCEHATA